MDTAEAYRTVRARLLELAAQLDDDQAAAAVPALPAWTVRDTYAHMAGLSTEVARGELRRRATDEDTARQVEQRQGRTLKELSAEWSRVAPELDTLMGGPNAIAFGLMSADVWSHEMDIRGALDLPVERQDAVCTGIAAYIAGMLDHYWRKHDVTPAVHFSTVEGGEWRIGAGEPALVLRTTDYEFNRILIGRRSRAQLLALDWNGDVEPFIDRLHLFDLPLIDLAV
ncbi:maleylpyruvate isomerase family mycothiol-dependent enzyme [Actinospica durhamensis]|uniref:Maleylpyruvate isomerase family mycothiol-dependent enzyme n=1 Tax=Actinospica durhamensis TaxID=1508375 RepID=A0A941IW25_9ACTN|nr:maleylpyruvate isomerase family mycothiol-dependent enzyme [Actinospica durhamensis]MBR7838346.1 maleylpyruvate isomerase family mycothiol-dependent enzyme [Actinospica durhamensis]